MKIARGSTSASKTMDFPSAGIWRSNRSFEGNEELSVDMLSSRMPIRDEGRDVKHRLGFQGQV